MPGFEHQHLVSGAHDVDESGFPGTRARRGVNAHWVSSPKYLLKAGNHFQAQGSELGAAVVDGWQTDRTQDAVWNRAGTRDLQEVTTRRVFVEEDHDVWRQWKLELHRRLANAFE
ncbi:hypothetical protein FQZ97_881920 [compost metagenome]